MTAKGQRLGMTAKGQRLEGNYIIYDRDGKILEDVGRLGMALYFGKFYPC